MKPTMKLQFVERVIGIAGQPDVPNVIATSKVLQQWWEPENNVERSIYDNGEWRDVPVETEDVK